MYTKQIFLFDQNACLILLREKNMPGKGVPYGSVRFKGGRATMFFKNFELTDFKVT